MPTSTLALLALWAAPAAAQMQDELRREPGTLSKAYQALVGDGAETLRVDRPPTAVDRPADPPPAFAPTPGEWYFGAGARAEFYGVLEPDRPDQFQVRRSGLHLFATRPAGGQGPLARGTLDAYFDVEATSFGFDDVSSLAPGVIEPVQDLFLGRLGGAWRGDPTREWFWSGGLAVEVAGEAEAEFGDALSVQGFGTVSHRLDDDLAVTVGALARTALEDDPFVIPIVGVEWTIDERQRVSTRGASLGYEFDLDDRRTLFADLAFQSREYRLDNVGPLPTSALSDRELRLVGGFEWRPGLHEPLGVADSRLRLYAGSTLYQELVWNDAGDEALLGLYQGPTLLLGIELSLTF